MLILTPRHPARQGFTLMETLIALSIFALAVVSLAEAIQSAGRASTIVRQEVRIHDRMAAITAETTRLVALQAAGARPTLPPAVEEEGVTYKVAVQEIKNLKNKDQVPVEGLWEVITTAEWMEGTMKQQMEDRAWVYPPLLPPLQ
ncbi:MAG: prepilin-type N-terminal cleavage/methylation domain-containing protein [Verrucomicrobiaceae bacterium]|jgi:prepilin-type N-terminal cleavage/methylation domain-containing protein|nr:prepilin-type N-terminal cleavage/methylation domain-containing protein [Verrucomicrobiaceae bacterium]